MTARYKGNDHNRLFTCVVYAHTQRRDGENKHGTYAGKAEWIHWLNPGSLKAKQSTRAVDSQLARAALGVCTRLLIGPAMLMPPTLTTDNRRKKRVRQTKIAKIWCKVAEQSIDINLFRGTKW